jgi:hypothetical protein
LAEQRERKRERARERERERARERERERKREREIGKNMQTLWQEQAAAAGIEWCCWKRRQARIGVGGQDVI